MTLLPYIVLLIISGLLGILICERKPALKKEWIVLGVMTLLMCAMAALRGENVGVDYDWVYRDYFITAHQHGFAFLLSPENLYRVEPVYGLLNQIVALFSPNPMVLWWTAAVVIILLRSVFIWRYASKPWLSVFCYIGLGFFTYALCTLRQELGISVAMFALPFLQRRKPLPYFAIILLAGLCHSSLFILLPVYFIATIPPNRWMIGLYAAAFMSVLFFSEILLKWVAESIPRFGFYTPDSYYLKGRDVNTVIIWILILVIAALLYKKLLERDKNNLVLFNLFLWGTLIMTLTMKHFVFQRVAFVFLPFAVLLIPEMVESMRPPQALQDAVAQARTNNKSNNQQLAAQKRKLQDAVRMYYSIMGLLMLLIILEYLFLLYANRLLLVPYTPFWM